MGRLICDIIAQLIAKMSDDRFYRGRKATDLIKSTQKLTSHALSAHSSLVLRSNALLCEAEHVVAENGSFTCIVRGSTDRMTYRFRVSPASVRGPRRR